MTLSEIKSIKANADLVKVISHSVQLTREGVNYIGSCPFHNERSKSFMVSPVKGIFKCFGCGKSGDVIDYVIKKNSFTYTQAIQWISEHQNITPDTEYEVKEIVELEPSFMDVSLMNRSLSHSSNFMSWIISLIPNSCIDYHIGASKHWPGAVVFWYVDINNQVRSGKIMQYNPETGKRIKEPKPLVTWVHRVLRLKDFHFAVCLFGENLLRQRPDAHVCIVESEKSAIVASIKYPEYIWLASGSLTNLTYKRCQVLEGRNVTLYPDVGAEDRWQEKMEQLSELIPAEWSLHRMQSEVKGYDICDMIVDNL